MSDWLDKVAVVTGAASGIGRALSATLARRGATVVLGDINGVAAEAAAESLRREGNRAAGATLDVTDADAVAFLIETVVNERQRIDLMVNNAGVAAVGDARSLGIAEWRRMIDVNLLGVAYGTHAAYSHMTRQGFGHIVNVASTSGLIPMPWTVPYTAAKHGVVGLSLALRAEGAALGVRVSVACPGLVDTRLLARARGSGVDEPLPRLIRSLVMTPERCAQRILRGVERNEAIIFPSPSRRIAWWFYRLFPAAGHAAARLSLRRMRRADSSDP